MPSLVALYQLSVLSSFASIAGSLVFWSPWKLVTSIDDERFNADFLYFVTESHLIAILGIWLSLALLLAANALVIPLETQLDIVSFFAFDIFPNSMLLTKVTFIGSLFSGQIVNMFAPMLLSTAHLSLAVACMCTFMVVVGLDMLATRIIRDYAHVLSVVLLLLPMIGAYQIRQKLGTCRKHVELLMNLHKLSTLAVLSTGLFVAFLNERFVADIFDNWRSTMIKRIGICVLSVPAHLFWCVVATSGCLADIWIPLIMRHVMYALCLSLTENAFRQKLGLVNQQGII